MTKDKYSGEECEFCLSVAPFIEALDADPTPYESVCGTPAGQQLYGLPNSLDLSFLDESPPSSRLAGNASTQGQVRSNASSATGMVATNQTVRTAEFSYAQVTQMGTLGHVPPNRQAALREPEVPVPSNDVPDDSEYSEALMEAAIIIASNQLRPQAAPFVPARLRPNEQPNVGHVAQPVRNEPIGPQCTYALNVAIQGPVGPPFQPYQQVHPVHWTTQPRITYIPPPAPQRLHLSQQAPYHVNPSGVAVQRPQRAPFHPECGPSNSQPIIQYIRLPIQQQQQQQQQQTLQTACEFQLWNNTVSINQSTMPQQSSSPLIISNVQQSNPPQPSTIQLNQMGSPFVNGQRMSPNPVGFIWPVMARPTTPTPPATPTPPPMPRIFVNYVPQPFIQQGNYFQNAGPFLSQDQINNPQ